MCGDRWYRHVALHMESVRLLVLPPGIRLSHDDDDSFGGSDYSAAGSAGFSGKGNLSTSHEQPEVDPRKSIQHQLKSYAEVEKNQLVEQWFSDISHDKSVEGIEENVFHTFSPPEGNAPRSIGMYPSDTIKNSDADLKLKLLKL
jgi:hypothetical protein